MGEIPDDLSDEWMERIVRVFRRFRLWADSQSLGRLKEWRRAKDGNDKLRPFGFAIFEDAESTNRASKILQELEIPSTQSGKKRTKFVV